VYRCGGTPSAVVSGFGWLAVWLIVGAPVLGRSRRDWWRT
jgi:hypothetical protein